jgi:hypothetical protein
MHHGSGGWIQKGHLNHNPGLFIIIDSHLTIILIITLVIKECYPHWIRLVDISFQNNGSHDADTTNVRLIFLDILNQENEGRIRELLTVVQGQYQFI